MMLSAWLPLVLAVLALALVPLGLKWLQRRMGAGVSGTAGAARVVSAVAVGPHQRVVTVEVGPEEARVWLTLGVTAQNITCLHTSAAVMPATPATPVGSSALTGLPEALAKLRDAPASHGL